MVSFPTGSRQIFWPQPARASTMSELDRKLAQLGSMSPAQLRALWRECWRRPAPDMAPDLLRRGIAWKLQSRVHGALPSVTQRALDTAAERLRRGEPLISVRSVTLKPGTRLVREWRRKIHQVVVLDQGYEHEGRLYSSLTQIASAITGVHCSGPRFFGLKKRHALPPHCEVTRFRSRIGDRRARRASKSFE